MKIPASLLKEWWLLTAVAILAMACGGDDQNTQPAATSALPTIVATAEVADSPTAAPTATDASSPTQPAPTAEPSDETGAFLFAAEPSGAAVFTLTDVRVGAHPEDGGFDRIVFEFEDVEGASGAHPGGSVEYVDEVFACGSGDAVEIGGEAILRVQFQSTQAHDNEGSITIAESMIAGPGDAIVNSRQFCDFEGLVQWAIELTGEQAFTVTFLDAPSRVVIDVQWP